MANLNAHLMDLGFDKKLDLKRDFIPFERMTLKEKIEHLVVAHGLERETLHDNLDWEHWVDHSEWDGQPEQVNEHTHTKGL